MMLNPFAAILQQARHALIAPSHPSAAEAIGGPAALLAPARDRRRRGRARLPRLQPARAAHRRGALAGVRSRRSRRSSAAARPRRGAPRRGRRTRSVRAVGRGASRRSRSRTRLVSSFAASVSRGASAVLVPRVDVEDRRSPPPRGLDVAPSRRRTYAGVDQLAGARHAALADGVEVAARSSRAGRERDADAQAGAAAPAGCGARARRRRCARRSSRPRRPVPRDRSAPPRPSSATSTSTASRRRRRRHRGVRGAGVAVDVRERLGDRVVERRLDRRGQPLRDRVVDLDGHRAACGQRLHRRAQPVVGQHRGMDAARELAQLGHPRLELGARRAQRRLGAGCRGSSRAVGGASGAAR